MSNRIRILGENVINRIAAGEVVERPASVVKELVENAIDAGASSIELVIEDGGKRLIRVKDNGTGMGGDDAFLALERHATSKLMSEKDLIGIPTMGFRGEALASIASVSKIRLMTRAADDELGIAISCAGGSLTNSEPFPMKTGSTIEVRNLFYNAPVRKTYLKSTQLESAQVHDIMQKIAFANPSIGFTFVDESKIKLQVSKARSLMERIYGIFSPDISRNLVELNYEFEGSSLFGYFARPPYTRASARHIMTFVNFRPVRDRLVNASIMRSFSSIIERGRYPLAIVFIKTPPEEVDVNVHPQKAEVRFVRPARISSLILNGVSEAVMRKSPDQFTSNRIGKTPSNYLDLCSNPARNEKSDRFNIPEAAAEWSAIPLDSCASKGTQNLEVNHAGFSGLKILGKLPNSFLVLNDDDSVIIMDHHAAHERLIFNELCNSTDRNVPVESQDLLIPEVIELTPIESEALNQHLDALQAAGFIVEEFGPDTYLLRSIPWWLPGANLKDTIRGFVDVALDAGIKANPEALRTELLKSLACKAAIKEGPGLENSEIRELLRRLDATHGPSDVCPHGRPILVRITFDELRRRMGRK